MSNRFAKFISALFATILAGTSFAAVPEGGAKTADNCLSAPKGAVPPGHHWYYRFDRATKRQCWYSREEIGTVARGAPQALSPPSKLASPSAASNPFPPPRSPTVPKSLADARAEFRVEPGTNVSTEPQTSDGAPAAIQSSPRASAPEALAPSSPIASRWPDASGVISSSSNQRLAAAEPPASPQDNAATAPQPATVPVALAAADASLEKPVVSMQMLLLALAGALALAGISASLIFRFGPRRPEIRHDRRAIWDQVRSEPTSPSMFADDDMPVWRARVPRDPRAPDDPERRVTEMLARLARSAQT
jgi:hypothetical protein